MAILVDVRAQKVSKISNCAEGMNIIEHVILLLFVVGAVRCACWRTCLAGLQNVFALTRLPALLLKDVFVRNARFGDFGA